MLNELYTLDRSLKRFNVAVGETHPWVKRLGRANVLIAGVNASGVVTGVELMQKQDAVTLFQIQKSFHSNFPKLNWDSPMWNLRPDGQEVRDWQACDKDVKQRARLLRSACAGAELKPEQIHALTKMREFCSELAPRFREDEDGEFAAFGILLERLLAEVVPRVEWVRSLSDAALASAESGPPELQAAVETLLAGKKGKVPILFDLADCTKFRCRVASPRMGGYFSRRLTETETAGTGGGRCALTGLEMPLESDKLPSPRLPVLGDTYLMSMNVDTPCQTRYGRIGTEIFPVGEKTAIELNAALVHLTTADREGKNWSRIPGRTKKKFNLLLVYLEPAPLLEARIAEMFSEPDKADALYTKLCGEVGEALRGTGAKDSDLLHLFVLNKIDPGRVQVELSESFTAGEAILGGEDWVRGCGNRPRLPLKDDEYVPSPTDAMRCLQMMWERGGASYADAPGCRLAEVYDVLIAGRPGAAEAAETLLRLTLRRTADLLIAIGHAVHRGRKEAWKGISREAGRNPVIAASLFGITLSKLGERKESYMQEPAFLIGRFLSLADTLHAEYCKEVRKGDMPPQLLGNALIPTAIGDPNRGLARMLDRIGPYQAWARRKGTGLARWSCSEMGKIAGQVAVKLTSGKRFDDADKAQLLLGYLARTESKEENRSEEGAQQ